MMKHINAAINTDKIPMFIKSVFYGIEMAQHAI